MKNLKYFCLPLFFAGALCMADPAQQLLLDGVPVQYRPGASRDEMLSLVYEELLCRYFTRQGCPLSETDTFAELKRLNLLLPQEKEQKSEEMLRQLSGIRANQLSTAARKFFAARIPELEQIEEQEMEETFKRELHRFTKPAKIQCSVMAFSSSAPAEKARAELLQGSNFEQVCQKYSAIAPQGAEKEFLPLLKLHHPKLSPMLVSDVLKGKDYVYVILVREYQPGELLPPDKIKAYLREEIISKRTAELMEFLLRNEISNHKIELPQTGGNQQQDSI
jgi:hypothetical protein